MLTLGFPDPKPKTEQKTQREVVPQIMILLPSKRLDRLSSRTTNAEREKVTKALSAGGSAVIRTERGITFRLFGGNLEG